MADQGIGDPANPKATDSTSSWTVISLLKAIVGNTGGGGSAVSIADGSDVAEGATSDAAITAGATGTVSAKLRAISRDIATLLTNTTAIATSAKQDTGNTSLGTIVTNTTGLATSAKQDTTITDLGGVTETVPATDTASSGLNGRLQRIAQRLTSILGVLPATLGSTTAANSLPVTLSTDGQFVTSTGALTETAPATDIASSGLNGRLQRIAQRITSLIALLPTTLGRNSDATSFSVAISTEDAALVGAVTETAPANDTASSGLNGRLQRIAQNITTLISSVLKVVGNVAIGAAASGSPILLGTKDTAGNVEYLFSDTTGRAIIVGAAAANTALTGNPILIGGSDGTNVQTAKVNASNYLIVAPASQVAVGDSQSVNAAQLQTATNTSNSLSVNTSLFNGTTWDRQRGMTANTALASAARTATVSTDVTNYNGRTFAVTLNITVAPNTAGTLTIQIRAKDSISGNYVTLLASAAILGSATTGAVPVTNRYVVALGDAVSANLSANDALARTMNVNAVHSTADSWTYSISVDIGL